jgi:Fanconi anemia group M protein
MAEPLSICIDSGEASGRREIVNYLRLAGFDVEIRRLDVCDYVVSDRCGVERKAVSDFLGSMKDGRLFKQARAMAEAYEKPILILEGRMTRAFKRSRMRPASVYGALASLALEYGLSVIPTEDPDSTAILLHRLAYREQAKEDRPLQLRSVRRDMPPDQQQLFLLSGLPQIGVTLAEELLRSLETPYRVLEELASAEVKTSASGKTKRLVGPLKEIKGVGPVIVESAQRLLNTPYSELCEGP